MEDSQVMSRRWTSPLIDASELAARLDDPDVRIADVRWYLGDPRRGRAEYAEGHIPGAVFVDLDRDLAAASGPGRHPLPDPTAFADRLGELGFGDQHTIAVYDTASGMVAARLWWMLDRLGHRDVAVLDGGLAAWEAAGGTRDGGGADASAGDADARERAGPTRSTGRRSRRASRRGPSTSSTSAPAERYRGEVEPVDRVPGHIPGARNRPAGSLLDDHGRLLPPDRLAALLRGQGDQAVRADGAVLWQRRVACLGVLAARLAGLPEPLLYPGSYSDWSAAGLPIATGERTP